MLTGPDVSHHQGAINWWAVRGAGHTFALCKATEGRSFVDDRFRSNWAGIPAAGLVRGAYHFLRSENDPAAQARHFVGVVGDLTGALAVLDVERSGAGTSPTAAHAEAFAATFAELTGGHPLIIYTGRWYWVDVLGNPRGAHLGPLWHSAYTAPGPGALYGGWDRFAMWQYTSKGTCPGVGGLCDLNVFYGELGDLLALTHQGDDMPLNDDDITRVKAAVRDVLNEGTGFGQVSWGGTSAAILSTVQHVVNQNVAILKAAQAKPDVDEVLVAQELLPRLLAGLGEVVNADELVTKLAPALAEHLTPKQVQRFLAELAELAAQVGAARAGG